MLTVKKLRETCPPQEIMAWSGLFAAPMMFVVALASSETIVTPQLNGWLVLLGLALVSHFAGQGLIAYAFGHLPASLTSLNLLLQPVFAAVLAWVLLARRWTVTNSSGQRSVFIEYSSRCRSCGWYCSPPQ